MCIRDRYLEILKFRISPLYLRIILIYDKITLIYSVKNAFNPTSEVQNNENGVFQNAPFANACLQMGVFQTGITVASWLIVC